MIMIFVFQHFKSMGFYQLAYFNVFYFR